VIGVLLAGSAVLAACAATPLESDQRVAVVIGSNIGVPGDHPLEYAAADAARFYELLVGAGGVDRDRAYLVTEGGAAAVRRALLEAVGRLRELSRVGPTAFVVYVSAHADEEALHLAGDRLPLDELRRVMRESGATLRLAILDACRTPVISRPKGGQPGPEVRLALDRRALVEGDVLITSAGLGEPAQEWRYLRGALFTHHLVAGLRGVADVDQDGRVSLAEAYAYAFRKTVSASAEGSAGLQHPAFDISMSGWGEWTFSRPANLGATVVLAPDLRGSLLVVDREQQLVADVQKQEGEELRIAVRPGWYRVVQPEGSFAGVAEARLALGGEQRVSAADFVRVSAERALLRGGDPIVLRPWGLAAGYRISSALVEGAGPSSFGGIRLERAVGGGFSVRVRGEGSLGRFRGQGQWIAEQELSGFAGASRVIELPFGTLALGVEAGVEAVHQDRVRDDQGALTRLFGLGPEHSTALVPLGGPILVIAAPILDELWIELEAEALLARVPVEGQNDGAVRALARGGAALSWRF
jgi:hypothetical protein